MKTPANKALLIFLFFAYILRLVPSLNSLFLIRADEVQFWDMAHKSVFGYGCIAWEYRVGARSWLYVWPLAAPLLICKWLGFADPSSYIPIVKSFLSAVSLIVPFGMWRFMTSFYDSKVGWLSLVLGCLWYELCLTPSHGLTEFYTVYLCFGALALWSRNPSAFQAAISGFLLGLALIYRPHNAVPISVIGGVFLYFPANRVKKIILIGGAAALILACALDWLTFGRLAHSFILYGSSIFAATELQGLNPHWQQIVNLALCSLCVFPAMIGYGILHYKKHGFLISVILAGLIFFTLQGAQEYSYIAIIIPFLLCLLAYVLAHECDRLLRFSLAFYLSFVCALGFMGKIPPLFIFKDNWKVVVRPNGAFFKDPVLETAWELSRMPSGSVIWGFGDAVAAGGYYVFHHHRQIFFPGGVPAHAELIKNRDPRSFARYLVLPSGSGLIEGFHPIKTVQGLTIHENDVVPENQEIDGYHYELQLPMDQPTIQLLLNKGLISSEPPLTPWKK